MLRSEANDSFRLEGLDSWVETPPFRVDAGRIAAYAAATNERHAELLAGTVAPPVFAVVPIWDALEEASSRIASPQIRPAMLHGEQDIIQHRPIKPGMELHVRCAPVGLQPKSSGTVVILKAETRADDGLVNEQYVTQFYRGVRTELQGGRGAPPQPAVGPPAEPVETREISYPVDDDQTFRYARASGDHYAIHTDEEAARQAGLPGLILHGLCVMAFAGRAVVESVPPADVAAVTRLAVRFAQPALVSSDNALTTRVQAVPAVGSESRRIKRFEVRDSTGVMVLKNGWAEFADGR